MLLSPLHILAYGSSHLFLMWDSFGPSEFFLSGANSLAGISVSTLLALYISLLTTPLYGVFALFGIALGQTFFASIIVTGATEIATFWFNISPFLVVLNWINCGYVLQLPWKNTNNGQLALNTGQFDVLRQSINPPNQNTRQLLQAFGLYSSLFFVQTLCHSTTMFGTQSTVYTLPPIIETSSINLFFFFAGTFFSNLLLTTVSALLVLLGIQLLSTRTTETKNLLACGIALKICVITLLVGSAGMYPWRRHLVYLQSGHIPTKLYKQRKRGQAKGKGQRLKRLVPNRRVKVMEMRKRYMFPWVTTKQLAQTSAYATLRDERRILVQRANETVYNVDAENPERGSFARRWFQNSRASKPMWLDKNVRPLFLYTRTGRYSEDKLGEKLFDSQSRADAQQRLKNDNRPQSPVKEKYPVEYFLENSAVLGTNELESDMAELVNEALMRSTIRVSTY
uniref:Hypothetical chloroplast RF1 n=1 Tax=prasinophyte sp. MBIC10622 TaxID=156113 RepID=A0A088CKL7_9CHLO|nr:hypothetical chloroplast RF1 [prasinophyte sp. MBIC10622]